MGASENPGREADKQSPGGAKSCEARGAREAGRRSRTETKAERRTPKSLPLIDAS